MTFDALLLKNFDVRWAAYAGYHYNHQTTQNSLFNYGVDDFAKKLECGFSYRIDDHNRLVMGTRYDMRGSEGKNVDYYWYHDIHCAEVILRYKSLQNAWSVRWQFTPW